MATVYGTVQRVINARELASGMQSFFGEVATGSTTVTDYKITRLEHNDDFLVLLITSTEE